MIEFEEARSRIARHAPRLGAEIVRLSGALGRVLSADIRSPIDLPLMDNSAMDGFALRAGETKGARPGQTARLKLTGVIKAGDRALPRLKKGCAVRIMTGAPLPPGADTVVALEDAVTEGADLVFRSPVRRGQHVRRRGEEIRRGRMVLRRGSRVHPGTVALLAALGVSRLRVVRRPRIAILATGSELKAPGSTLSPGQIYDSNSWMADAACRALGLRPSIRRSVPDEPARLRRALKSALARHDVVLVFGGVSVGDFDFVKDILAEQGVRRVFWKIDQKPGKPVFFGKRGRTLVFGVPGNPASAYIVFLAYVVPALRRLMGDSRPDPVRLELPCRAPLRQAKRRVEWVRARLNEAQDAVVPLGTQGSHMVASLHDADGLILNRPGGGKKKTVTVEMVTFR